MHTGEHLFHQHLRNLRAMLLLGVLGVSLMVARPSLASTTEADFQLDYPQAATITVQTQFTVTGRSNSTDLMLSLRRAGTVANPVYAQQRLPVKAFRFNTQVWLPWGSGEYEVGIWQWSRAQNSFRQLTSFRVVGSGTATKVSLTAPPALLWDFDMVKERIEKPALAYSTVEAKVPIRAFTSQAELMITVTKDNQATKYVVPAVNGVVETSLWLTRGQGRYDVTLWRPSASGGYVPWAAFAVENRVTEKLTIDEAPRWFDSPALAGKHTLQITGLDALAGGTSGVKDGKLLLSGKSKAAYLTASIEKNGETARYRVPVAQDGTFNAIVWLRFGSGIYTVTLWANLPGTNELQALVRFAARLTQNLTNRYLAPSLGIESDHTSIIELANHLARKGTDARNAALAIHDWVSSNISYDVVKYRSGNFNPDDGAVKTLQTRKGVCQDYAYLTVALLRAAGYEARIAVGQAKGGFGISAEWGPHAWTEVRVANRWLVMDTTWDAGYVATGNFVRKTTRTYFDPKPEVFAQDHQLAYYDY